jgi:DNA-binding beta-propeller fold protein YncE
MQSVKEVQRHRSPGGRPQPLAFYAGRLWVGAWDTVKLYAIDPHNWSVTGDFDAPGKIYGIAAYDDSLCTVVGLEDDNRYLVRFVPQSGFDEGSKRACPDFTGSHLATDGTSLYLCQQGNQRILVIDGDANVRREISLPTRCGGVGFAGSTSCFIISADEEWETLALARLDVEQSAPAAQPIATISPEARALAYDGAAWWTSEREIGEIVAFTVQS